jgi:hypothetical protein|nr:MAG TPA: hypothetical protein [Caudoviricetes sp.]
MLIFSFIKNGKKSNIKKKENGKNPENKLLLLNFFLSE